MRIRGQMQRHYRVRQKASLLLARLGPLRLSLPAIFVFFLSFFCEPASVVALDIAILKSSDIAAYNQAVAGFKTALPSGTTFTEYNMQGDVSQGRKHAQKIHDSGAELVLAVGLKAALVAKMEIQNTPVIFCMET